jgi:hypothetical protein
MGRIKLKTEKKPSVWDRRKQMQRSRSILATKPADVDRANNEAPEGLPEGCTWVSIIGVAGDPTCQKTGDIFESAVRRLGKPFVVWEKGIEFDPGDIPVMVLYATTDEAVKKLGDTFGRKGADGRYEMPIQTIRSLKTGDGVGAVGPVTVVIAEEFLAMAKKIRDDADPPVTA